MEEQKSLRDELVKLITGRFPKITYKDCMAFVQELELELSRLHELQASEDK